MLGCTAEDDTALYGSKIEQPIASAGGRARHERFDSVTGRRSPEVVATVGVVADISNQLGDAIHRPVRGSHEQVICNITSYVKNYANTSRGFLDAPLAMQRS